MTKKNDSSVVTEVQVEDSAVPVFEVTHPGENADDSFHQEQAEALGHYRLTGEAGTYIDPTRDQEPDIAPELGVSPHPEMANPAPPAESFSGNALDVDANPMLKPVNEKAEDAKEATEAFNEVIAAKEEAFVAAAEAGTSALSSIPPSPVYVVDGPQAGAPAPLVGSDESPKSAQGDPTAQQSNASDPDNS